LIILFESSSLDPDGKLVTAVRDLGKSSIVSVSKPDPSDEPDGSVDSNNPKRFLSLYDGEKSKLKRLLNDEVSSDADEKPSNIFIGGVVVIVVILEIVSIVGIGSSIVVVVSLVVVVVNGGEFSDRRM
jgi:hypothetical protein